MGSVLYFGFGFLSAVGLFFFTLKFLTEPTFIDPRLAFGIWLYVACSIACAVRAVRAADAAP
jgi:hypothetical protein